MAVWLYFHLNTASLTVIGNGRQNMTAALQTTAVGGKFDLTIMRRSVTTMYTQISITIASCCLRRHRYTAAPRSNAAAAESTALLILGCPLPWQRIQRRRRQDIDFPLIDAAAASATAAGLGADRRNVPHYRACSIIAGPVNKQASRGR